MSGPRLVTVPRAEMHYDQEWFDRFGPPRVMDALIVARQVPDPGDRWEAAGRGRRWADAALTDAQATLRRAREHRHDRACDHCVERLVARWASVMWALAAYQMATADAAEPESEEGRWPASA